jgi:fused signal recognition particle receptor
LSELPAFSAGIGQVSDGPPALPLPALPAVPAPLPAVPAPPLLVPPVVLPALLVPPPLLAPPAANDPALPADGVFGAPPPATPAPAPAVDEEPALGTLEPPLPADPLGPSGSLPQASTATDSVKANIERGPEAKARGATNPSASRFRPAPLAEPRLLCSWHSSWNRLINDLEFTPRT